MRGLCLCYGGTSHQQELKETSGEWNSGQVTNRPDPWHMDTFLGISQKHLEWVGHTEVGIPEVSWHEG